MDILSVCGVAIIGAAIVLLLKKWHPEASLMAGITVGVMIFAFALVRLEPVFSAVSQLAEKSGLPTEYGVILIKSLGICYLTQLASDACKDAGAETIAGKAELAGKAAVLLIAFPLFSQLTQRAIELISL
ncbi:MAG: stage III sporulation protein AD [Oscillospiraceae bacterium]|nr:stage III sporulation protein AD [Oscillospiraceae bacterium]